MMACGTATALKQMVSKTCCAANAAFTFIHLHCGPGGGSFDVEASLKLFPHRAAKHVWQDAA